MDFGLNSTTSPSFPTGFTWGAAAAAYQLEGAWNADDKGISVWDAFSHESGKVFDNHTGDTACDHYHRYREDIGLMREIGLPAYRMSLSWPRILPDGIGRISEKGLAFYDRLIDELLAAGVEPWVTLFHWDYPYALYQRGGWLNPDSPRWFAEYTAVVMDHFSDRVRHWMTLNEPQCFIGLGHLYGEHAPGLKLSFSEVLLAAHHSLMAHGMSVQVIRARSKQKALVGWAPVGTGYYPATDSQEDRDAAWRGMEAIYPGHLWNTPWWGDPPVLGHYPEEGLRIYGSAVPKFKSSDMETICQPLDFYGCNIYHGGMVKAGPEGREVAAAYPAGYPQTHFHWRVTPEGLYWAPRFLADRYKLPIVVTENGLSSADWVSLDGKVHDPGRIDFLHRYLLALHQAIQDGADIRGYFHWSIMDNFEWAEGYKHRFGLIHVDFGTQQRTLKDSAHWYREVIRSNGASLFPPDGSVPAYKMSSP